MEVKLLIDNKEYLIPSSRMSVDKKSFSVRLNFNNIVTIPIIEKAIDEPLTPELFSILTGNVQNIYNIPYTFLSRIRITNIYYRFLIKFIYDEMRPLNLKGDIAWYKIIGELINKDRSSVYHNIMVINDALTVDNKLKKEYANFRENIDIVLNKN